MPGLGVTAFALVLILPGPLCAQGEARFEAVEPCMGTLFRITLYAPDSARAQSAFSSAFALAHRLDESFSDYRPQSELNRLGRLRDATVSPELFEILTLARTLARETNGAFDPTAGPLVRLWRAARSSGKPPTPAEIDAALRLTGWKKITLDSRTRRVRLSGAGMQLDLGGIAKGYTADRMLAELRRLGIRRALVAASGDLAVGDPPHGQTGWRIALGAGGPVELIRNRGVSTSGDTEQYTVFDGVRYSHIIDPRTGWALRHSSPVTVIAKRAALADALATALSVDPAASIRRAHGARIQR